MWWNVEQNTSPIHFVMTKTFNSERAAIHQPSTHSLAQKQQLVESKLNTRKNCRTLLAMLCFNRLYPIFIHVWNFMMNCDVNMMAGRKCGNSKVSYTFSTLTRKWFASLIPSVRRRRLFSTVRKFYFTQFIRNLQWNISRVFGSDKHLHPIRISGQKRARERAFPSLRESFNDSLEFSWHS